MAEKKITKVQKFEAVAKALEGMSLEVDGEKFSVEKFCAHEVELIQKKASSKKTKVSDETIALMDKVRGALTSEGKTVSEIIKSCEDLREYVPQKITPILTKLVAEGTASKEVVKGKSLYKSC